MIKYINISLNVECNYTTIKIKNQEKIRRILTSSRFSILNFNVCIGICKFIFIVIKDNVFIKHLIILFLK